MATSAKVDDHLDEPECCQSRKEDPKLNRTIGFIGKCWQETGDRLDVAPDELGCGM